MSVAIGDILRDTWRLDRLLGQGASATVYAASHVRTGAVAAIKILKPELAHVAATRFHQEGRLANLVPHRAVIRVLDDGELPGTAYLVCELVEGESLKQRWVRRGRRMSLPEIAPIVSELLDLLVAAHERGVLHRDIKPDNIMLGVDGSVKLADFGLAKLLGAEQGITRTGAVLGTPAFMSPEQAMSKHGDVDATTDLYALAATARTMMSGRLVHDGETVPELLVAAASRPVTPTRSVLPELRGAVADVLDRALAFEKTSRFPSARAMLDAWKVAMRVDPSSGAGERALPSALPRAASLAPPAAETLPRTAAASPSRLRGVAFGLALVALGAGLGIGAFALARSRFASPTASSKRLPASTASSVAPGRVPVIIPRPPPSILAPVFTGLDPSARDACARDYDELGRLIGDVIGKDADLMAVNAYAGGGNVIAVRPSEPKIQAVYSYSSVTHSMVRVSGSPLYPGGLFFQVDDVPWRELRGLCKKARAQFARDGGGATAPGSYFDMRRDSDFNGGRLYIEVGIADSTLVRHYCFDAGMNGFRC